MEYIVAALALLFFPLFIGSMLLPVFWEKNAKEVEKQEKSKEIATRNVFGEIKNLIHETEDVLKKALEDALAANDSLWVSALTSLSQDLSDLSDSFQCGKTDPNDARARILDLRRRVDRFRNPPPRESSSARPKPNAKRDVPIEELAYLVLGVNRSADGYQILGVSRGASKEDVDKSFKQKQLGWHPDKFPSESDRDIASAVSKILNNARDQIYKHRGWK